MTGSSVGQGRRTGSHPSQYFVASGTLLPLGSGTLRVASDKLMRPNSFGCICILGLALNDFSGTNMRYFTGSASIASMATHMVMF